MNNLTNYDLAHLLFLFRLAILNEDIDEMTAIESEILRRFNP